jgi:lysozyme family protein
MADSTKAIAATLVHEGGYVDNPADRGGATNMGIEQHDLPNIPIQTLTVAQATAYYLANYWKPLYSQISDQALASKIFDMGVLFGVGTAVRILQGIFSEHGIVADGVFGPVTLEIVNMAEPVGLLTAYKNAMNQRAVNIVASNFAEAIFLTGWQRRIAS